MKEFYSEYAAPLLKAAAKIQDYLYILSMERSEDRTMERESGASLTFSQRLQGRKKLIRIFRGRQLPLG